METGTITEWKVKEGEAFAAGDIICLVETDKVNNSLSADQGHGVWLSFSLLLLLLLLFLLFSSTVRGLSNSPNVAWRSLLH